MGLRRIRLRTLMIVVAAAGIPPGLVARHRAHTATRAAVFDRWWRYHTGEAAQLARSAPGVRLHDLPSATEPPIVARHRWHETMAVKYRYAASHPWAYDLPDPGLPRPPR